MLRRPLTAARPTRQRLPCRSFSTGAPQNVLNPKGKNVSLWAGRNAASSEVYSSLRPLESAPYDVIVVGAGITGLTSALNLKRAGMRVAVLEHHQVGSGATGNSTGHISLTLDQHYSKLERNFGTDATALMYQGQVEARTEIERNCRALSIPGFEGPIDAWIYAEPGQPRSAVFQEYETMRRLGVEGVDVVPTRSPIGLPFVPDLALKIPGSAQFDAHRYCQALAKAVHGNGSAVYENTRVTNVKDGAPCEVHTDQGAIQAREVITATHVPLGISVLQAAMIPYTSFAIAVRVQEPFPAGLFYDTVDPYHYLRRLDADNTHIVIVGGDDKKTGAATPLESECFDALRRYTWSRFKSPHELACWSAQLFASPDGAPYVGTDPGSSHVWIATGFSGDGLTLGTVAANVISQAIQGKKHPLAAVYSSHRFKPLASAKQFVAEQLSVAKHLVADRMKPAEHGTLQELKPGEGRVAQVGVEKIAAYRDTDGKLHVHSAVCTHMKCIVNWNNAEMTFDCPCHGSRFSATGKVLEGPAYADLPDVLETTANMPQTDHTKEAISERMSRM